MTDPRAFLDYGWIGLLVWLLAEKLLPIVRDIIMPQRAEERRAENERRQKLEERHVKALEEISALAHAENAQVLAVSEKVDHVKGDTTAIRDNTIEIKALLVGTQPKQRGGMARPLQ